MPVKILTTEQQLGSISEYLNNKVDLPRGLSQGSVDYVIEKLDPTAENNYTWYRLYKSGWVEQGGNQTINDSGSTISLPIYMNNNKYFLSVGYIQHSDGTTMPSTYDLTTINFKVNPEGWWKVSGQSS